MRFFTSRLKVPVHQAIHENSRIQGTLQFRGGLLIEGTVTGELQAGGEPSFITIGKHGSLTTSLVEADTLIVNGFLRADGVKTRQVVLGAGSDVKVTSLQGNLVEIQSGAKFEGAVLILGEAPAKAPTLGSAGQAKERLLNRPQAQADSRPEAQER